MLEYPNGETVLYRDAGMFWMRPSQAFKQSYRLRLLKDEGMIEVTISSRYCCKQITDISEIGILNRREDVLSNFSCITLIFTIVAKY